MATINVRHLLIGKPFPTSLEIHERLDKFRALAVFASDPISSNAYATEAIMSVLIVLGSGGLAKTLPIGLAVTALVLMVIFSYIQTIMHYPDGGGAYIVTKDNLGVIPSLFAAAALLTDYILTVSVSVSAGVRAVSSAFPAAHDFRVPLALFAVALITWINLRGVRESGTVFAVPTYAFVFSVFVVILIGLARFYGWFGVTRVFPSDLTLAPTHSVIGFAYIWLILRAFAGGCTALTGIEAISNGVKAFEPPESKNAATTMVIMGLMAMGLFAGITFLSTHLGLVPSETESVLSQLARAVTGNGVVYYAVQIFTMLILFLAANTGFQDFPRLSSYLAKDGFMPRWMQNRGDRLVFSSGILSLAAISSVIVIIFQADEIRMLPLYALGVMLSFSLSQTSMVKLMGRIRKLAPGEELHTTHTTAHAEKHTGWKQAINATGAVTTSVVFIVLVATKFHDGAWMVVAAIPLLVYMFFGINKHYERVAATLRTKDLTIHDFPDVANVVIVPIADVHRGTLQALQYAKRLSDDVRAVCVMTNPGMLERLTRRWERLPEITNGVNLITIDYDYRDILTPLVEYIEKVHNDEFPNQLTTIVIPEFVPDRVWGHLLHNRTASSLRYRLQGYQDIVIIDTPFQIRTTTSNQFQEKQPVL